MSDLDEEIARIEAEREVVNARLRSLIGDEEFERFEILKGELFGAIADEGMRRVRGGE